MSFATMLSSFLAPVHAPINAIALAIQSALYAITFMVQASIDPVAAAIQATFNAVALAIKALGTTFVTVRGRAVRSPVETIVDAFAATVQAIINMITSFIQSVVDAFAPVVEALVDAVSTIPGRKSRGGRGRIICQHGTAEQAAE